MTGRLSPVSNIRDYGCAKVLRLLDSYLAGELTVETNHELLEHLERCLACRQESEARERLRVTIRSLAGSLSEDPRPGFEDEVRALLARTPAPSRVAPLPVMALIAASLLGVAGAALVVQRHVSGRASEVASALRSDRAAHADPAAFAVAAGTQMRCTLKLAWPNDPPPLADVEAKLDPDLVPALKTVAERTQGYRVLAAHRCVHTDREVIHFVLRKEGLGTEGLVSIVAVPKTEGGMPDGAILAEEHVRLDGQDARVVLTGGRREGFDIVGSETKRFLVFVVGSRGQGESLELGRRVLPAMLVAISGVKG